MFFSETMHFYAKQFIFMGINETFRAALNKGFSVFLQNNAFLCKTIHCFLTIRFDGVVDGLIIRKPIPGSTTILTPGDS